MATLHEVRYRKNTFCRLRSLNKLSELLTLPPQYIRQLAENPEYNIFSVPKKNGEQRLIENPSKSLKAIQAVLNDFLQAVYWLQKTPSAYGFVIRPTDAREEPRNIVTNARQHLNKPWLLNADLEDFFHYVKADVVMQLFMEKPFGFPLELADLLTRLMTLNGRLPMGAPTSPVLSNLAFQKVEMDIQAYANQYGWHFTRYADDMSFSSDKPITLHQIDALENIVKLYGYEFNPNKVMLYGPDEEKSVTGLRLDNIEGRVELHHTFPHDFQREAKRLKDILTVQGHLHYKDSIWVTQYKQQIGGKLQFAEQVLGNQHPDFRILEKMYDDALQPPDEYESISWLDFTYF
jgi:RNA-directed DNA polymerase